MNALAQEVKNFKESILHQIAALEDKIDTIQKLVIHLEEDKSELEVRNQELKEKNSTLETENEVLREANEHVEEEKREHIRTLEKAVDFLNKRHRTTAYSLDSSLSPTREQPGP